jgi:hypothetical protein
VSRRRRRGKYVLLLLLVVALVNLPLVHSTLRHQQIENEGVATTAEVVGKRTYGSEEDPHYWVSWVFDEDVDRGIGGQRRPWSGEVDKATYDAAADGSRIRVRVVPGKPSTHEVEGAVRSRAGLWSTLVADAIIALVAGLLWAYRRRHRVRTVEAVTDVVLARPGAGWEDLGDGTSWLTGEVVVKEDGAVELEVEDQPVRVVLGPHTCPVGYQQPARVRVRND